MMKILMTVPNWYEKWFMILHVAQGDIVAWAKTLEENDSSKKND